MAHLASPRRAQGVLVVAVFFLYLSASAICTERAGEKFYRGQDSALSALFHALDRDGNGQIEAQEAQRYIESVDESYLDGPDIVADAARNFIAQLDSADMDHTVSQAELERSLAKRLKGTTVENWVQYGLGMPQYRDAFFTNGVTVLDFPLLLQEPSLLFEDLGISSSLHRRQLQRAMQAIVLGLGAPPRPPANVQHSEGEHGTVIVTWSGQEVVAHPPTRQLVVERSAAGADAWAVLGSVSADSAAWCDRAAATAAHDPRHLAYRVVAWSALGRSTSPGSTFTTTGAASPCAPQPPTAKSGSPPAAPAAAPRAEGLATGGPERVGATRRGAASETPLDTPSAAPGDVDESSVLVRWITGATITLAVVYMGTQHLLFKPLPPQTPGVAAAAAVATRPAFPGPPAPPIAPAAASPPACGGALAVERPSAASHAYERVAGWLACAQGASASRSGRSVASGGSAATHGGDDKAGALLVAARSDSEELHPVISPAELAAICDPQVPERPASRGAGTPERAAEERVALRGAAAHSPRAGLRGSQAATPSASGRSRGAGGGAGGGVGGGGAPPSAPASSRVGLKPSASMDELAREGFPSRRLFKVADRCNMEGCRNRPRGVITALVAPTSEMHYCCKCQRQFCLAHTGFVSHGGLPFGRCPLDSACHCQLCWAELSRSRQSQLRSVSGAARGGKAPGALQRASPALRRQSAASQSEASSAEGAAPAERKSAASAPPARVLQRASASARRAAEARGGDGAPARGSGGGGGAGGPGRDARADAPRGSGTVEDGPRVRALGAAVGKATKWGKGVKSLVQRRGT